MRTIPTPLQLYTTIQKSEVGVQGYHVNNKYYDPMKMKFQRLLQESKSKYQAPKQLNVSKKKTFIDQLLKKTQGCPGPSTYCPQTTKNKSTTIGVVKHGNRKTFVDEIQLYEKKNHIPGSNVYQNIDERKNRKKSKSNLSRSENTTYLDGCMRNSIECPGVGAYNSQHDYDHRLGKWVADPQKNKKDKKNSEGKLPSVGSYNPNPVAYKLFSSLSQKQKLRSNAGLGGKSQRFKYNEKQKKLPFYNVLSQWGMKNKLKKKDIMSNISTHRGTSQSVYY